MMLLIVKILMATTIVGGLAFSFRTLILSHPHKKSWNFFKTIVIVLLVALALGLAEMYLEKK